MPVFNMTDLRARLSPGRRLLGLDLGSRTIGIALSDVGLRLASPYGQIRRGKLAVNAAEIARIAAKEEAGGLVVGLPLGMGGEFGPAAQRARDWSHALAAATGLPASLWDERETTAAAHEMLIEQAGMGRQRRAAVIDRMAAAL
ncbi:MAG TPA: Holliday junction resolvase RuvX, partial [Acetobacteraceae bacterium]|nr:Holliday junction resolvase RuvX [Acetobacteraceae bacterium]